MPTRYLSVASVALVAVGILMLGLCVITRRDIYKIAGEKSFRGRAITLAMLLLGLGGAAVNQGCHYMPTCYMPLPPRDPAQVNSPDRIAAHDRLAARMDVLNKLLESNQLQPEVVAECVYQIKNDIARLKDYGYILREDSELINKADEVLVKAGKLRYPGMGDQWISIKQNFKYVQEMAAQKTTTTKERKALDDRLKGAQQSLDNMVVKGYVTKDQAAVLMGLLLDMKSDIKLTPPSDFNGTCYRAVCNAPTRRTVEQVKVRLEQVDKILKSGNIQPAVASLIIPELDKDLTSLRDYKQAEKDNCSDMADEYFTACFQMIQELELRIELADRINALGRELAKASDNAESRKEIAGMLSYIERLEERSKKKYPLSQADDTLIKNAQAFVNADAPVADVPKKWNYVNETFAIARRLAVQKTATTTAERKELNARVKNAQMRVDALCTCGDFTAAQAILLKGLLNDLVSDIAIDPPSDFMGSCYLPAWNLPAYHSIEQLKGRLAQLSNVLAAGGINPQVAKLALMQFEDDLKPLDDPQQLEKEKAFARMKEPYADAEKERDACKAMIAQLRNYMKISAELDACAAAFADKSANPAEAEKRLMGVIEEIKKLQKQGLLNPDNKSLMERAETIKKQTDNVKVVITPRPRQTMPDFKGELIFANSSKDWQNINDTFVYARKVLKKQRTTSAERGNLERAAMLTSTRMEKMVINYDMTKKQAELLDGLLQDIIDEIKVNPPSDSGGTCYMMAYSSPAIRSVQYLKVRVSQVAAMLKAGNVRPEVAQLAITQLESELKPLEDPGLAESQHASKEDAVKLYKEGMTQVAELKKIVASQKQVVKDAPAQ